MPQSPTASRRPSRSRSNGKSAGRSPSAKPGSAADLRGQSGGEPGTASSNRSNDAHPCNCWQGIDIEAGLTALTALSTLALPSAPATAPTPMDLLVMRLLKARDALLSKRPYLERLQTLRSGTGTQPTCKENSEFVEALYEFTALLDLWAATGNQIFLGVNKVLLYIPRAEHEEFLAQLQQMADSQNVLLRQVNEFLDYAKPQIEVYERRRGEVTDLLQSILGGAPESPGNGEFEDPNDIDAVLTSIFGAAAPGKPMGGTNGGPRVIRIPISALAGLGLGRGAPRG